MPDISMCPAHKCPMALNCYRSPLSGTLPSQRQVWMTAPEKQGQTCMWYLVMTSRHQPSFWLSMKRALTSIVIITIDEQAFLKRAIPSTGSWHEGFSDAWALYSHALLGVVGPGLQLVGTLQGELKVFYESPVEVDQMEGVGYRKGFIDALTSLAVGTVSLMESFPDPTNTDWQSIVRAIAATNPTQVSNERTKH